MIVPRVPHASGRSARVKAVVLGGSDAVPRQ